MSRPIIGASCLPYRSRTPRTLGEAFGHGGRGLTLERDRRPRAAVVLAWASRVAVTGAVTAAVVLLLGA